MTAIVQVSSKKRTSKTLLAEYPKVLEWYSNLKRSSPSNADKCLQRLEQVHKTYNITPAQLAKLSPSLAYSFILKVVTDMDNAGKQPTYIQDFVKSLKSWFAHNGKQVTQKVKLPKGKAPTKAQLEQSPVPEQLCFVLDAADPKQKVEAVLVGLSGFRPESVGSYLGDDGLKVGDLPEMRIDNDAKSVTFTKIPTLIVVREALSKAGHQYFSFMPEQGCNYIKQLLEIRMRERGETLTNDSPIVNAIKHNKHYGHIRTQNIGDSIRGAIRKAGYDWRPYILRTYFDTRMLMAEADGLIIRDFRVFFMGHKGSIEAVYTPNKRRLPEDLIEKMRDAFAKASDKHLITLGRRDISEEKITAGFNRQFLKMSGLTDEDVSRLGDLTNRTPEELKAIVRDNAKNEPSTTNGNTQKVVFMDQVELLVNNFGWQWVGTLPNGKAVLKSPNA